jgi:dipeptidyl-peptidase-4
LHTLTQGEWEAREIVRVDEKQGDVWFMAGKDGACASNLYRVKLDGGEVVRVTQGRGTHDVELNGDASLLIDTWSAVDKLPVQRLCKPDGSVVRVLAEAKPGDIGRYEFSMPKLLAIPTRDGLVLDGVLIAPGRVEPGNKHALWIETYSGPDTPTVKDRWHPDARLQFYAQNGIAVLQVNVRSASNKGRVHTGKIYKNFTAQELKDWEDALDWVCKQHPWIDPARVGMTGMSYGGTMTAYTMTHSNRLALGIACSGVYDWRLYDTIYTERYMDTPQANPDGYKSSSCISAARKLQGHLVLLHGTIDDNVHLQNTIRFAYALQNAGKDFEMMLYPKTRHELASTQGQYVHRARLFWKQIQQHLGGPRKAG